MSTQFFSVVDKNELQSNQKKKTLQSNSNRKTNLNYEALKDTEYSNVKCNKYNKVECIVETTCNVKDKVKTDWINLCCKDKPNKHDITDYGSAECCKNFMIGESTLQFVQEYRKR